MAISTETIVQESCEMVGLGHAICHWNDEIVNVAALLTYL